MDDVRMIDERLSPESRRFFLAMLRDARAAASRDAEAFQEILFSIERLGAFLHQDQASLGKYKTLLVGLAKSSPLHELAKYRCGPDFDRLYDLVQYGRNDAMHQGASARHLVANATTLALVLEDAIVAKGATVQDFMVRNPVCAEMWQPLALIRQQMLLNSFSYLPVRWERMGKLWWLVADFRLAKFLRCGGESERGKHLATSLADLVRQQNDFLVEAQTMKASESLQSVLDAIRHEPMVIVDASDQSHLMGIVTGFDVV